MNESIDELSIAYTEDSIEKIKQLDKYILSRGAWTTILFKYQEWVPSKNAFGPNKYAIRRYQKRNDQYWLKSKFTLSSDDQVRQLVKILGEWVTTPEA